MRKLAREPQLKDSSSRLRLPASPALIFATPGLTLWLNIYKKYVKLTIYILHSYLQKYTLKTTWRARCMYRAFRYPGVPPWNMVGKKEPDPSP